MFLDFALISGLLVVAHLLRTWVRLFQTILLPTPILAGLIGLGVGPEGLDLLPFARDAAGTPVMTRYPGELVVLLFATLFMGWRTSRPRFKEMIRDAGDTFFYNLSTWIGQFGLALLFAGAVLIPLFRDVARPFALMLPAGFAGGHGTVAAVGSILAEQGHENALPVGYTFATIGLLAAVLGGVAAINIATRSGWTRLVSTPRELRADQRRGADRSRCRSPRGEGNRQPPGTRHPFLALGARPAPPTGPPTPWPGPCGRQAASSPLLPCSRSR